MPWPRTILTRTFINEQNKVICKNGISIYIEYYIEHKPWNYEEWQQYSHTPLIKGANGRAKCSKRQLVRFKVPMYQKEKHIKVVGNEF